MSECVCRKIVDSGEGLCIVLLCTCTYMYICRLSSCCIYTDLALICPSVLMNMFSVYSFLDNQVWGNELA